MTMDGEDEGPNEGGSNEDNGPQTRQEAELREGVDYYLEDGLFVFTATFLRQRGYCCESGCRNCPYTNRSVVE